MTSSILSLGRYPRCMAKKEPSNAVQPLTVRPVTPRRLPAAMALALLAVGASAGYLFGLPNDTSEQSAQATTLAPATVPVASAAQTTPAHYNWLEQQPADTDQDAWAVHGAVELSDDMFLLVSEDYEHPFQRALWVSPDGETWNLVRLDLGPEVFITDLDTYDGALLLSGWHEGAAAVWRSQPLARSEEPVWTRWLLPATPLQFGNLRAEFSSVTSEINSGGELVVTTDAHIDLNDTLVGLGDDIANLLEYGELPEIAVADSRLWMRIITKDGVESVFTEPIPPTVKIPAVSGHYGTDVRALPAGSMWTSNDGATFLPVDLSGVPAVPSPMAFDDIFVSVIADGTGTYELWSSASGATWTSSLWDAPAECGGWQGVAVGGNRLFLVNDVFDTICLSNSGTDWTVRSSVSTRLSSTAGVWIEGSPEGYLAAVRNSQESAVLTSNDGFQWHRVEMTPDILVTRMFLVGDRLVATARPVEGITPLPMIVWVGELEDQ